MQGPGEISIRREKRVEDSPRAECKYYELRKTSLEAALDGLDDAASLTLLDSYISDLEDGLQDGP
jgi:hypothetical protein